MNEIQEKVTKLKRRTNTNIENILRLATERVNELTTNTKEQNIQKILNKMRSRILGFPQEYDIFYEKLCIHIEKYNEEESQLFYYDDAKIIDSFLSNKILFEKKNKNSMSNDILGDLSRGGPVNGESSYNYNEYELNYLNSLIPVRNIYGFFYHVLDRFSVQPNQVENNKNLFCSSSFNFSPILRINKLKEKTFWIEKNENTELFYELYTTFSLLNFEPYENFILLKDIRFREHIFKEWENNFRQKTTSDNNTVRNTYISIMKDCFVYMGRFGDEKVSLNDLENIYGIKNSNVFSRKRKRNRPKLSPYEKERLVRILRVFNPKSYFKLFNCSPNYISAMFNTNIKLAENFKHIFNPEYQKYMIWGYRKNTYLTPIEHCLANYAVLYGEILSLEDGQVWSFSQKILVPSNSNFPDLTNNENVRDLGLYNIYILANTTYNLKYFCDLVNARHNSTQKRIFEKSLKEYMESYYKIFVRNDLINGISEYQSETLNITNITLFPGNFVFMLDYIQQNL